MEYYSMRDNSPLIESPLQIHNFQPANLPYQPQRCESEDMLYSGQERQPRWGSVQYDHRTEYGTWCMNVRSCGEAVVYWLGSFDLWPKGGWFDPQPVGKMCLIIYTRYISIYLPVALYCICKWYLKNLVKRKLSGNTRIENVSHREQKVKLTSQTHFGDWSLRTWRAHPPDALCEFPRANVWAVTIQDVKSQPSTLSPRHVSHDNEPRHTSRYRPRPVVLRCFTSDTANAVSKYTLMSQTH